VWPPAYSRPLYLYMLKSKTCAAATAWPQRVCHVALLLALDCIPLFLSDGFKDYLPAIFGHFGFWLQPERCQGRGPMPKPRWMPLPRLLYAQVIKTVRRRRLVWVSHRVVFGTLNAVEQVVAACGWQINTAFIERMNLSMRQHVAAVSLSYARAQTACDSSSPCIRRTQRGHVTLVRGTITSLFP
jgi:hypothetical protein